MILSPKQSFFMYQCPKFIRLCSQTRQVEISEILSKSMIQFSNDIFDIQLGTVLDGKSRTQVLSWYIELLNYFALTPNTREFFVRRINFSTTMVDHMIGILRSEPLIISVHKNAELFHADVALMSYSITLLYNLTFEKKIFYDLKYRNVISVCEKLYEAIDRTIQFASRTLGAILNQEDIDEIDSPSKVARSYLYFIENTIDDITLTYHGIRLDGVLTNLETIVQNDEIKEEITNDGDGIPLIARCAYEPHLDIVTIQRPALRILDAISFASRSAIEQIKENDILMDHIKDISRRNDRYQISTANRLLWKVEEEAEFISKQDTRKKPKRIEIKKIFNEKEAIYQYVQGDYYFQLTDDINLNQYDIMISFCHDDIKICRDIYNHLLNLNLYRISFDEDNTHELNHKRMAQTIENSSIVIICFSNKYRLSYACRLEAEYVVKRQRPIIPVKIDPRYDPTGWLSKIIDNKTIVDLTKPNFQNACQQLVDEIYQTNAVQ
ncbi:hypothetical protein I4U23_011939 [Adineta vaga]|nr:hypothetical protein I4U23_011939 [Adineta vaga]